jgi:DNA repair photolyase
LHKAGIATFVMIAPILPESENLVNLVSGKVDYVLIDRMNYHYADRIYRKYGMEYATTDEFFIQMKNKLVNDFKERGIPFEVIF